MKKIILTFGTIAGLICIALFYLKMPMDGEFNMEDMSRLYGYACMTIGLSTIFFAVRQYRDKYNDGMINFGKAFMIGLGITLIATLIYIIAWEIYFNNIGYNFPEQYIAWETDKLEEAGLSPVEIQEKMAPLESMMDSYKNSTITRIGFTAIEIFPVGLLISIISALILGIVLRRKQNVI